MTQELRWHLYGPHTHKLGRDAEATPLDVSGGYMEVGARLVEARRSVWTIKFFTVRPTLSARSTQYFNTH